MMAWQRLNKLEEIVGVALQVDWSFEAVKYYWNPDDPYFDLPDQPDCIIEVLRAESDDINVYQNMMVNVTAEAEKMAKVTDKIVDLANLREAIARVLHE